MHVHLRQADLLYVVNGRLFIALLDLRSDTGPKDELWLDPNESLIIPPGVAHGYAALEPAVVLYLLDHESDGSDELGFAWSDPEAAIGWPVRDPILSERDRTAGSMRAARALVRDRLT